MPTYNCGRFIEESIKSVQNQTYTSWELFVVDDCSNDGTVELVQKMQIDDERIILLQNESNLGAAVSRNRALEMAKGRWVAFLDADDIWEPGKLERQIAFMEENQYSFSYHEYIEIDENNKALGIYVSGIEHVGKYDMYACCWPGCLTVMYDQSKIGLIQIKDIKRNNDTAMWLRVVQKADCYLLKECLAKYRRRSNSITPISIWQRICAHYPIFRVAEEMNPVKAVFWVIMNVFGNTYKKIRYVRKYKEV